MNSNTLVNVDDDTRRPVCEDAVRCLPFHRHLDSDNASWIRIQRIVDDANGTHFICELVTQVMLFLFTNLLRVEKHRVA